MIKIRFALIAVLFGSALISFAGTPEDAFVQDIKEVTTAETVDAQLPVFQKIGATYRADPDNVPPVVKSALVQFMKDTASGAGPLNIGSQPSGFHGSVSNKDDIPLGIAMMLVDYKTTGAADALVDLSMNTKIPRSVRDRCVGFLRQHTDDVRLQQVGSFLVRQPDLQDKQVGLLAFAAMKKPSAEAAQHIMAEIENPSLNLQENIVSLMSRADMSEEAVDLSLKIMQSEPATASELMPAVADAKSSVLKSHAADLRQVLHEASDPKAKSAAQSALQKASAVN